MMASLFAWSTGIALFGPPAVGVTFDWSLAVRIWIAVVMASGTVVCAIGIAHPDIILAAFLELAGLFCVVGPLLMYVGDLLSNSMTGNGALNATAILFIAGSCMHRMKQLIDWLRYVYDHPIEQFDPELDDPGRGLDD